MRDQGFDDETASKLDVSLLSPREREVLEAALEGGSARDIALRLSVTEATIRSHLAAIYSKLGVSGRVELLARLPRADRQGIEEESGARHPAARASRRFPAQASLFIVSVGAVLTLGALLAVTSPSPSTDLSTVSGLVASDSVAALSAHGGTLAAVEKDGRRLLVDGVPPEALAGIAELAAQHSVPVNISSDRPGPEESLALVTTALLPVAFAAVLGAIVWRFRPNTAAVRGS